MHGGFESVCPVPPVAAQSRKEPVPVAVERAKAPESNNHVFGDGDFAVTSAFPVEDAQDATFVIDVRGTEADGFADA
jgi:hypothetical protein